MCETKLMKVKVIFFASFKELLSCSSTELAVNQGSTIADLCKALACKGSVWEKVFIDPSSSVKIACNQRMAELSTIVNESDEVAFFPPVTGG